MTATTWHGRRGAVILGPTEHRIARWLADRTRSGRVTIRTVDLAAATHVERSEAYRITRRLRILGLFGVEDDRGGTRGGRRYWRTAVEHDAGELDATRHREAWARVVAWARARRRRLTAALHHIRDGGLHTASRPTPSTLPPVDGVGDPPAAKCPAAGGSFLDRLVAAGLPARLAADFAEHRHR